MSSSFDFDEVEWLVAGCIGEPGQRTFFIQASAAGQLVSLKLEKQQVALLADYLDGVLGQVGEDVTDAPPMGNLVEPVIAEWVVGSLAVAHNERTGRIVLLVEEAVLVDDEADEVVEPDAPATARFALTSEQIRTLVDGAHELVAGGRPICPICRQPMSTEGHVCPRTNGHGRP